MWQPRVLSCSVPHDERRPRSPVAFELGHQQDLSASSARAPRPKPTAEHVAIRAPALTEPLLAARALIHDTHGLDRHGKSSSNRRSGQSRHPGPVTQEQRCAPASHQVKFRPWSWRGGGNLFRRVSRWPTNPSWLVSKADSSENTTREPRSRAARRNGRRCLPPGEAAGGPRLAATGRPATCKLAA